MKKEYDAIGFGNSIIDYTANVDDSFLEKYGLRKGDWKGIKKEQQEEMEKDLEGKITKSLGGSASNTIAGMNNLGSNVVYCGTVGDDENGRLYKELLGNEGIKAAVKAKKGYTGIAITAITPDKERSFGISMGASGKLKPKDIPKKLIKKSRIVHTTCYALEQAPEAILEAAKYAKKNGALVSIDLGSPATIKRNYSLVEELIKYADIIFANELEAKELTGKEPESALGELSKICQTAIIKLGKGGAIVKSGDGFFRMYGLEVNVKNTNGAGDAFAAGFLNSMCTRPSIARAALVGTMYAAKVVQVEGARLNEKKQEEKEIKIELPDQQAMINLRNTLLRHKAEYDDSSFEKNMLYETGNMRDMGEVLRLRVNSSGFKLTFKGRKVLENGVKTAQEIEADVKNIESTIAALQKSGFAEKGCYEKYREVYAFGGAKFMLDHICNRYFVEIEASSEAAIHLLMMHFGLNRFRIEENSYAKIFGYSN